MTTDTWIPQDLYNRILDVMPIVCVDVVIIHNERFLLIRREREPARGKLWLPGGRLHKGEGLIDCALRKAQEECGLDCLAGSMVHYASTVFERVHSVNFCYLLYAKTDLVTLDDTSSQYQWVGFNHKQGKLVFDFLAAFTLDDYVLDCLRGAYFI